MPAGNTQRRNELPLYNKALGPAETALVSPPPFNFPGVTARVFPLRASMNTLRDFCDKYLNVSPGFEFIPAVPFVLLVVLDYGRMAIEQSNMGWISQREVLFEVPLGMWKRDGRGRRKFVKWVVNTPFIVVDNASSLTTGREVYGWPKVLAVMKASPQRWLQDPRNALRLLTLDVKGLSDQEPDVRLLDIEQQLDQNASLTPPDLGLIDPFVPVSRVNRACWSIGFDLAQYLLGAPLAGFDPQFVGQRREVLSDSLRRLSRFYERPGLDVVTLKQFPDAEDPTQICYQALVESRLSVAHYNRGGLLGLYNLLQGDITGGFRIRIHENPAFPIISSLGLEVKEELSVLGRTAWFLEPFFPSWMSVDLTYGKGKTLCWRTRRDPWHVKGVRIGPMPPKKATYNTIAGGAEQVWCGPYYLPNSSFGIYPLEACPETIEKFLNDYLNADQQLDFVPIMEEEGEGETKKKRAYVFMYVSVNRLFSKQRSGAFIESSQIAFHVPLLLYPGTDEEQVVLATPFTFVDNPVLATALREFEGVPAMNASIEVPSRFLRRRGPQLKLQLDVFESLRAGLRSSRRTLLELFRGEKVPKQEEPSGLIYNASMSGDLGLLMLKQFRDTEKPDRACYQSLVVEPWSCSEPRDPTPLRHKAKIHIYRYPSIPLVETLGLITTKTLSPRESGEAIADVLEVAQPYWVSNMNIEIGLGREISHTVSFLPWQRHPISLLEKLATLRSRKGDVHGPSAPQS